MKCEKIPAELLKGKKIIRLKNMLGVSMAEAVGLMAILWLWAESSLPDGDFGGLTDEDIAGLAGWSEDAGLFCTALRSSGFFDGADGAMVWAGWDSFIAEKKEEAERAERMRTQARVRKQRQRAREASEPDEGVSFDPQNVTRDMQRDTDFAGDYRGIYNNIPCGGGDAVVSLSIPEEEKRPVLKVVETVENCASWLSSDMDAYGVGKEVRLQCEAIAGQLFRRYAGRRPTRYDVQAVFRSCYGVVSKRVEEPLAEQLTYAFEQSAAAGKGGDWRYISGVMERLKERGINTVGDAMEYDLERRRQKYG